MRIVKDHSVGAYAVKVTCLACGKMLLLADAAIDCDGPAFRAYYHEECLPEGVTMPRGRCNRDGCTRCVVELGCGDGEGAVR